mmetsp:Transcript_1239/g.1508  ORF Transcript_1239/g.1508 Transcript_1239/m.1508 type:complete len:165 (+) Transcript_1239:316-810(+)
MTDSPSSLPPPPPPRIKGGRPTGSTNQRKRDNDYAVTAALNAAVERILDERSSSSNNKLPQGRTGRGMDTRLLIEVHRDHNLPDTVTLNQKTVLQRIFRKQTFVSHEQRKGGMSHVSPLLPIEPYLCDMLIILSKLRHALTPKESIMLINALIDGTPHQIALIE